MLLPLDIPSVLELRRIAASLRQLAARSLGDIDIWKQNVQPDTFADGSGNRVDIDGLLLARVLGRTYRGSQATGPDIGVWQAIWDERPMVEVLTAGPPVPLVWHRAETSIEVWTESEFIALHGLWHVGLRRADRSLLERCASAAAWHVANTQPDNATALPWASHVFFIESRRTGDWSFEQFATTLTHNCQVAGSGGVPDPRAAVILLDSADAIDGFL